MIVFVYTDSDQQPDTHLLFPKEQSAACYSSHCVCVYECDYEYDYEYYYECEYESDREYYNELKYESD